VNDEWISVPELARRIGLSKESLYRLARVDALPGAVQLGRRYTVNYSAFCAASKPTIGAPVPNPLKPPGRGPVT
jgi:hypothetical protein